MDQKTLVALAEKHGGMVAKAGKEKCVIFDAKSLSSVIAEAIAEHDAKKTIHIVSGSDFPSDELLTSMGCPVPADGEPLAMPIGGHRFDISGETRPRLDWLLLVLQGLKALGSKKLGDSWGEVVMATSALKIVLGQRGAIVDTPYRIPNALPALDTDADHFEAGKVAGWNACRLATVEAAHR